MKSIEEITKDLIRIESVASNRNAKLDSINYLIDYFSTYLQIRYKKYEDLENPFLIICNKKKTNYDVIFSIHLDVVDGKKKQFVPIEKDGKIYGRGAADMKGAAAIVVKMYEELLKEGKADNVCLMFSTDEETGSKDAGQVILTSNIKAKCCVVPDNRCLPFDHIVNESKGIIFLKIYTKGKSAHGSRPWLGINANELLIEDLLKIRKLFNNQEDKWEATLNIGKINGGESVNKIPDHAEAKLDIRTTQVQNNSYILEKLKNEVRYSNIQVEFEDKPFFTKEDDKYFLKMKNLMTEMLGKDIPIMKEEGGSEARFFAKLNIPTFLCKPLSYGAHEDIEWVDIDSMYKYLDIYKKFVLSFN